MQGRHQPHPMMHRLHNASQQECVGDTANAKHVTWGGVQVRHIRTYKMDSQRIGKISKENLRKKMVGSERLATCNRKKHTTHNV